MITVTRIAKTCYCCPSQWEGLTDDNRQIYVRYRWGSLSITLGEANDMSRFAAVDGKEVMSAEIVADDEMGATGFLTYAQLRELVAGLVTLPDAEAETVDWQND